LSIKLDATPRPGCKNAAGKLLQVLVAAGLPLVALELPLVALRKGWY